MTAVAVWGSGCGWSLAFLGIFWLSLTFPEGRLPSGTAGRVGRLAIAGMVVSALAISLNPLVNVSALGDRYDVFVQNPAAIAPEASFWQLVPATDVLHVAMLVLVGVGLAAMLARARRATGLVRLQYRWLIAALVLIVASTAVWALATRTLGMDSFGVAFVPVLLAYAAVPAAIAVAVLRYRLYEIDRIISRTLSWATVSGVLVVVFAGLVVGLQALADRRHPGPDPGGCRVHARRLRALPAGSSARAARRRPPLRPRPLRQRAHGGRVCRTAADRGRPRSRRRRPHQFGRARLRPRTLGLWLPDTRIDEPLDWPRRVVLLVALGADHRPAARDAQFGWSLQAGLTGGEGTFGVEPFLAALGLLTVINAAVGVAILWRRPGNLVGALLLIGALMMTSVVAAWTRLIVDRPTADTAHSRRSSPGGRCWASSRRSSSCSRRSASFFPDGRLPGPPLAIRRTPRAAAALIVGFVLQTVAPVASERGEDALPQPIRHPGPASRGRGSGCGAGHHRRAGGIRACASAPSSSASDDRAGVERAQVKWLVAAVALMSVIFPVSYLAGDRARGIARRQSVPVGCLLPIAIGIAVLRYRLYDIDRLISRTLSWAIVTGGVVTIFVLLVVGLQGALEGLTQGETLAVALSTIIAAALFQPVRRRVQGAVDRRFDRARYDGQRTIEAFAHEIRDEVDLPRLRETLVATAHDAVRPAAATLWLRESGR